jgi:hypothetical protein
MSSGGTEKGKRKKMVFSESSDEDEPKVAKKMAKTASHGLSDDEDFKTQVP